MVARVSRYKDLIQRFGIECYGGSKQIPLCELYHGANKDEHLEIDLIGLVANVGLLIEITDQKTENRRKIKKFLRHCSLFLESSLPWEKRLAYFTEVPQAMFSEIESVKNWKFVYFGESPELIEKKIQSSRFPEGKGRLFIFNMDDIEYLKLLSRLIGHYAKNEFLSALGFEPKDLGQRERLEREFLKLDNRLLSNDSTIKADIYMLEFSPEELLTVGRVFRYGGISVPFEEVGQVQKKGRYQRILIPDKLKAIATQYIIDNQKICFPNTVTLVLSEGCKEDTTDGKPVLLIPNRYASIDIIDGQHRIFAYAYDSISPSTRENARILASAIRFKTEDEGEKSKLAARTFWTINSRQATVKRALLYLIKYDVLGDEDPEALAGEIIRQCNDTTKELGRLFKTHPLRKLNKFEGPPIPITTIVQELAHLTDLDKILAENSKFEETIENVLGNKLSELKVHPEELIRSSRKLLEHYFSIVASVFHEDWRANTNSNILCANYIAAFIRLLRYLVIDRGISVEETRKELQKLKDNIRKLCNASTGAPTFAGDCDKIPPKKIGVAKIHGFLMSHF